MSTVASTIPLDTRTATMARLKTRLLVEGLRLELPEVELALISKPMMRVRSGSCGGLDLILPDGTWVNAPVRESFARSSKLSLRSAGGDLLVSDGVHAHPVRLIPSPAYYSRRTGSGEPMRRIGQLCSDRVGVGVTNACTFYRSRSGRCRFCSIGANALNERSQKADADILETVLAAVQDPIAPARHILLGGGTPEREDAGASRLASLARAIKEHSEASIYAMLAPPADLGRLELLAEAGVDEIGMNIEVFSERAARRYIPAKHDAIPLRRFWDALERAVSLFGAVNVRSITVVGLEPFGDTQAGVERLASIGVLPILSPLRRLDGTPLAATPALDSGELWELTLAAAESSERHGMPLGPVCIPCQSNTLTVPGHPMYRSY